MRRRFRHTDQRRCRLWQIRSELSLRSKALSAYPRCRSGRCRRACRKERKLPQAEQLHPQFAVSKLIRAETDRQHQQNMQRRNGGLARFAPKNFPTARSAILQCSPKCSPMSTNAHMVTGICSRCPRPRRCSPRKLNAWRKCLDDARSLSPPDGEGENHGVVLFYVLHRSRQRVAAGIVFHFVGAGIYCCGS